MYVCAFLPCGSDRRFESCAQNNRPYRRTVKTLSTLQSLLTSSSPRFKKPPYASDPLAVFDDQSYSIPNVAVAPIKDQTSSQPAVPHHTRALSTEQLESRTLLTVLTVNSALDNLTAGDGQVTPREAIIASNSNPDVTKIVFYTSLEAVRSC